MSSIFNYPRPHDLEYNQYRTGCQNEFLASVSESEVFYEMIRLCGYRVRKKPVASSLRLAGIAMMAGRSPSLEQKNLWKNLVKHFHQYFAE